MVNQTTSHITALAVGVAFFVATLAAPAFAQNETQRVDLPADAHAVESGKTINITFAEAGESAWLKLQPANACCLQYRVAGGSRAAVALFDENGKQVAEGKLHWVDDDRYWSARLTPQPQYLRLTCTSTDGKPLAVTCTYFDFDPSEPTDDKPQSPRSVEPNKPFTLRILPEDDVDHVSFTVEKTGYVVLTHVRGYRAPAQLEYTVFDPDGVAVADTAKKLARQYNDDDYWSSLRVRPGKYVLALRAPHSFSTPTAFRIDILEEVDQNEPNGEPRLARTVPLGWETEAYLLPHGDVDWLRVVVPHKGVLVLRQVEGYRAATRVAPALFDAAGSKEIPLPDLRYDGDDLWTALRVEPGEYLIRLTGDGAAAPVRMRFDLASETDLFEPNDGVEDAVAVDGEINIRSYPPGDVDWFTLTVDELSTLKIQQVDIHHQPVRYVGEILFPGETEPRAISWRWGHPSLGESDDDRIAIMNLLPGEYKIKLVGEENGVSPKLQTLRFLLTPSDDPFEPNDRREQARPVESGADLQMRLLLYDEDWFVFDAPEDGSLVFHFPKPPPVQPLITLFAADAEEGTDVTWLSWGGLFTHYNYQRAMRVKKGLVYFRIMDKDGWGSPVSLRVAFYPRPVERDSNLFVIALETDEAATNQARAIAEGGGGDLLLAEESKELPELLKQIVIAAEETRGAMVAAGEPVSAAQTRPVGDDGVAAEGNGIGWLYVAASLLALGMLIVAIVAARRRKA